MGMINSVDNPQERRSWSHTPDDGHCLERRWADIGATAVSMALDLLLLGVVAWVLYWAVTSSLS